MPFRRGGAGAGDGEEVNITRTARNVGYALQAGTLLRVHTHGRWRVLGAHEVLHTYVVVVLVAVDSWLRPVSPWFTSQHTGSWLAPRSAALVQSDDLLAQTCRLSAPLKPDTLTVNRSVMSWVQSR
jgi:hypothetical protein